MQISIKVKLPEDERKVKFRENYEIYQAIHDVYWYSIYTFFAWVISDFWLDCLADSSKNDEK